MPVPQPIEPNSGTTTGPASGRGQAVSYVTRIPMPLRVGHSGTTPRPLGGGGGGPSPQCRRPRWREQVPPAWPV